MEPTYHNGNIVLVDKFFYKRSEPSYNDIVVAKYHVNSNEDQIIKRVIGMPNDTICCVDGVVYVNGEAIDEYYLDDEFVLEQSQLEYDGKFTKDFSEFVLGHDEYFLLGDNRLHSSDSRVFGVFQKEDIVSKHVYVWYPFSEMRVVK